MACHGRSGSLLVCTGPLRHPLSFQNTLNLRRLLKQWTLFGENDRNQSGSFNAGTLHEERLTLAVLHLTHCTA